MQLFTKIVPIGWALRQTFKNGYHLPDFKADITAAFVVSLIALPLSMALAVAIGMSPQHGIYTAIIAGIAAALFGGSLYQISGPTAAFVVILIPIVAEYGLRGIVWCQILAGIILILCSLAKLGKLIHYVPHPVTTGFTAGIALVLAIISLKDFFGLKIDHFGHHFVDKISNLFHHLPDLRPEETFLGITTLLLIFVSKRTVKGLPSPIIGIMGGTLLSWVLTHLGYSISTIGSEFSYLASDGTTHMGIPPYMPLFQLPTSTPGSLFTFPTGNELFTLLPPAFIIALLIALESLLSATIADRITGTLHHPNAELTGIGIANILSGLASGIPATAAIARTATNIHSGAKSPFAAIFHGVFILTYVVLLSPFICLIPMSALAALLIFTAINMAHLPQFMHTVRTASLSDRLVLLTCFILTVFIDMVAGITIGVALASLLVFTEKLIAKSSKIH